MNEDKNATKERTRMLIEMRKKYSATVKQAQSLLKEQQAVRKLLEKAMTNGPRSVLQLARETGLSTDDVLWHVASMKKYGSLLEAGMDESGNYYLYAMAGDPGL